MISQGGNLEPREVPIRTIDLIQHPLLWPWYYSTLYRWAVTNSKQLASRMLTLTMSILTLLFFVFYTGDITAEMTSGPSDIPIGSFEDVIYHNYKVITASAYYENILARSKPGSAMLEVFKSHFEGESHYKNEDEVMKAMIRDSKALYYGSFKLIAKLVPTETHQEFSVQCDDCAYSLVALALQKDSEFLQIFNHHILKGCNCHKHARHICIRMQLHFH